MTARNFLGGAAATTLNGGINSGAASIVLADGSTYPTANFTIVIERGQVGEEKVFITSRSSNTLTVASRGYDGTTASAHATGVAVEHCATGLDFQETNDHVNGTGAVHTGSSLSPGTLIVPTSASPAQTTDGSAVWDSDDNLLTVGDGASRKTMVDTSSTQTLTGKTLTNPTVNFTGSGPTGQIVGDAASTLYVGPVGGGLYVTSDGDVHIQSGKRLALADFTNAAHDHGDADDGGSILYRGVRVYNSGNVSISNNTATDVSWNTERFDTSAFHDVGAPTRLTVPAGLGGKYLIEGLLYMAANATGVRVVGALVNGVTAITAAAGPGHATQPASLPFGGVYDLVAGDYVTMNVIQDSGGNLNLLVGAYFAMTFLGS